MKLDKSNTLKEIPLKQILQATSRSCAELIQALQDKLNVNFKSSCKVIEIKHNRYLKTVIHNKTSIINVYDEESPGNVLEFETEPIGVESYTYEHLKEKTHLIGRTFHGMFLGTIKNHCCSKTIDCPECNGTGICPSCEGTKKVECPVCRGDKECVSCNGTGRYTCEHCNGSGDCPDCNGDGSFCCYQCGGSGKVDCWDCNGTGTYYDNYHPEGVKCRSCHGLGTHKCHECNGKGGWDCDECDGSGKCSHCHGRGNFRCKACDGTGVCGKCKGHGEIWCPDCQGKGICWNCSGEKIVQCPRCEGTGVYQTYQKYTITEKQSIKSQMCYPIEEEDVEFLEGDKIYEGVIYDFYAKHCNVYNIDDAKKSVNQFGADVVDEFVQWISLDKNSRFDEGKIYDDLIHIQIENFSIPITEIVYSCRNTNYSVFILGNNKIVWYDKLPSSWKLFWGHFF